MNKKLNLDKCEVFKEGVTRGKAWTIYHAWEGSQKYSSFTNLTPYIGKPTDFEIEVEDVQKGDKSYKNYTIVGLAGQKRGGKSDKEIVERLDKIIEGLRALYKLIAERLPKADELPDL